MISLLHGIVVDIVSNNITIDVNGVGYSVLCSRNCLESLKAGEKSKIVIYTDVREDNISLFGFKDKLERQVFLLLKTVKGVGSKTGIEMLSQLDKLDLLRAIGSGDAARLQSLKGIGRKTAERIVLELREKVGEFALEQSAGFNVDISRVSPMKDAEEALMALGFNQATAVNALSQLAARGMTNGVATGEIVKEALKFV
ncbi:MAG: Holliday junction branch migration protein RuvA [bacterium]|nr:Holliday junction branch migration protein RuvA [bacterium]